MTTTPDSRIAHDWGAGLAAANLLGDDPLNRQFSTADIKLRPQPTLGAIDTSTTTGRIAVMQASEDGHTIEVRHRDNPMAEWFRSDAPVWNWGECDYRIAPPPVARTALQRARERTRAVLVDEATTGDVQLAMLVREIDVAPAVWFGSTLLDKCGIVGHAPGRYRLVRDDA